MISYECLISENDAIPELGDPMSICPSSFQIIYSGPSDRFDFTGINFFFILAFIFLILMSSYAYQMKLQMHTLTMNTRLWLGIKLELLKVEMLLLSPNNLVQRECFRLHGYQTTETLLYCHGNLPNILMVCRLFLSSKSTLHIN